MNSGLAIRHCRASGREARGRGFLRFFFALCLLPALAASTVRAVELKNVVLFIGDGMGPEQVKAARYYLGGPLSFESFPYQGWLTTYAANSAVTDSAAAATALATGHKVNNGVISQARPANLDYPVVGSEMQTLLEYFQADGKSTGLVTTTYVTHATPAAFGAHSSDRNNLTDIAGDYLNQTRPNVLFGGGANGMSAVAATWAGYTVVTNRAAMQALNTETQTRVSGQFGGSDLPYEYDGLGALPHLSEMTSTALRILDNDLDGFFLMVEGGLIDHAGHSNDIRRNVRETVEFGNSVRQAIDWAAGRNDTLILVAADHETGGLQVVGPGSPGTYPNVTWGSGGHTATNVPVYARGPNAELISGVMDNTYLFEVATAVLWATLTWDEMGPGNWDQPRWTGDVPPFVPDDTTHAVVKTDTVTVAGIQSAQALAVESGGVVIGPGATLTVGEDVDVAAAGTLAVAGTFAAQSLTTAGTSAISGSGIVSVSENVDVARRGTLEVAGTLAARSLTVAGASTISGSGIVSVSEDMEVVPGATLQVGGNLAAGTLTTAGRHLIADGAVLSVGSSLTLDSSLDLTGATLATIPRVTDVYVDHDGVLTLDHTLAAAELNVAGRVQTAGAQVTALNVTGGGLLMSSADVIAQVVNVTGGAIHLTDGASLSAATLQVTGGTLDTGAGYVEIGGHLSIGDTLTMDVVNGTFTVSSLNLADPVEPDTFTLRGGRVTISGGFVAPPGAIAAWKLGEGEGSIAADSSTAGNDHVGTIHGASWLSSDPEHGTVLSFDGEGDYLEAADADDIQIGSPTTIAMWIKTSQKGGKLLGKGSGDHYWDLLEKAVYIEGDTGRLKFTGRASGSLTGTTNVADGKWHHVAVTFNGNLGPGDQEIYVDGVRDTAERNYRGGVDNGDVLRLGWAETGDGGGYQEYSGLMDDVYIYDRSISAAEVTDLYTALQRRLGALPNASLRVTADSVLRLEAGGADVVLGNLALEAGVTLKVSGAAASFHDLNAGDLASIEGDLSVRGVLSPGESPGKLNVVGDLEMDSESTYQWELGASVADLVAVDGDLRLRDGWTLELVDAGGTCRASDQFDLFTYTGLLSLGSYRIDPRQVEASGRWDWSAATILRDGSRVYLGGLTVVPEPGTLTLVTIAALGFLAGAGRRRFRV